MFSSRALVGALLGATTAFALPSSARAQPTPATPPPDAPAGSGAAPTSADPTAPKGSGTDNGGTTATPTGAEPAAPSDGSAASTPASEAAAPTNAVPTVPTASAPPAPADDGEVIEVSDSAPAESASSVHLTLKDLAYRSRTQVSDVLRNVPGLVVSQHAGGGKSDQYFIRGFDADHGTDIAIYADGIPVNLTSHGHGQGYADTHWLIPETLESVDMHKGPYAARYGDFYTAGALELKTIDQIEGPTMWIAAGSPLTGTGGLNRRLVGMASPAIRDNPDDRSLLAVQIGESDGPFVNPQDFRHGNALAKWRGPSGPAHCRSKAPGTTVHGTNRASCPRARSRLVGSRGSARSIRARAAARRARAGRWAMRCGTARPAPRVR